MVMVLIRLGSYLRGAFAARHKPGTTNDGDEVEASMPRQQASCLKRPRPRDRGHTVYVERSHKDRANM